jgi:hypothetical protein
LRQVLGGGKLATAVTISFPQFKVRPSFVRLGWSEEGEEEVAALAVGQAVRVERSLRRDNRAGRSKPGRATRGSLLPTAGHVSCCSPAAVLRLSRLGLSSATR